MAGNAQETPPYHAMNVEIITENGQYRGLELDLFGEKMSFTTGDAAADVRSAIKAKEADERRQIAATKLQ